MRLETMGAIAAMQHHLIDATLRTSLSGEHHGDLSDSGHGREYFRHWICRGCDIRVHQQIRLPRHRCRYQPGKGRTSRSVSGSQSLTARRSEEHTSELQSIMRLSNAVVRLKKKKQNISPNK